MKHCKKCDTHKPLDAFYKNRTKKDGLQTICKVCCNQNSKAHFNKNPQAYKDKAKRLKADNTVLVKERKSVPCMDCGEQYPYYVMEFDHLEAKDFHVSDVRFRGSTKKLLDEMAKCDVVCRNCHAERTATRAGYSCLVSSIG